jgi:hypothetical protein
VRARIPTAAAATSTSRRVRVPFRVMFRLL